MSSKVSYNRKNWNTLVFACSYGRWMLWEKNWNWNNPQDQECTESGETNNQLQKQIASGECEDYAYIRWIMSNWNWNKPQNQECKEWSERKKNQKQTLSREREDYAYLARSESFGNIFGRIQLINCKQYMRWERMLWDKMWDWGNW